MQRRMHSDSQHCQSSRLKGQRHCRAQPDPRTQQRGRVDKQEGHACGNFGVQQTARYLPHLSAAQVLQHHLGLASQHQPSVSLQTTHLACKTDMEKVRDLLRVGGCPSGQEVGGDEKAGPLHSSQTLRHDPHCITYIAADGCVAAPTCGMPELLYALSS